MSTVTLDTVAPNPSTCQPLFPDPIPGLIPFGSVVIFSGASGAGKTILKAGWCRAWLDGAPILDYPTNRPQRLAYVAIDRPWAPTYASAFAAAGVPAEALLAYALVDDPDYDPRELRRKDFSSFAFLEWCLQTLNPPPGSLVFIDPFAPLFIQGNQNDARDVALSLHWLRRCAQRWQITVICDANVAKMRNDEDFRRPQDRIAGSGAFLAYADTVFNLSEGPTPDDPRTLIWVPRMAKPGSAQFEFDPETRLFVPFSGLKDEGETEENDRPSQVLKLLPGDGADREDWYRIAKEQLPVKSYSIGTFKRDVQKLLKRGLIKRDAWGHYTRTSLA